MNKINTEKVWADFNGRLRNFIFSKVRDRETGNDILQDVFLKVHSNLDKLNDDSRIGSWLYQVTRNAINDHYRKRVHTVDLERTELFVEPNASRENENFLRCMLPFINRL